MSHISVVENKIKFDDKSHLCNALSMMSNQLTGFTFTESLNGKIIQVHYDKIDEPVKRWHPEGNLRFNLKNDGEWEMSGDGYNCGTEYKKVCDAVKIAYQQSGCMSWSEQQGFSESEEEVEEKKTVLLLRRY